MSLIDYMMDDFVIMDKVTASDGEGGFTTEWREGAHIDAVVSVDTSMQARIAEKEGVTSTYTISTKRNVVLKFPDVLKRVLDGAIFRITSNNSDKKSPAISSLDLAQATAERWELTT